MATEESQVHRLDAFLREWRRKRNADTLVSRLERFCTRARPLLPATPIRQQSRDADASRLAILLPRLGPALRARRPSASTINPWTAAGLARREVRNAAVLASLWSPVHGGEAGTQFLRNFFARIELLERPLPGANELMAGYVVRTEHCPGADSSDRIDLVVETSHHLVGIEVKIDAVEGHQQLDRYVEAMKRSARRLGKRSQVILLAPFAPKRLDVLAASWADVRDAALASLPPQQSNRTFAHQLIAAFASHVRGF